MNPATFEKEAALTQERLKELLHYDPETGNFFRKSSRGGVKVGSKAGWLNSKGYWKIGIDGENYAAHRLAFLYVFGSFPSSEIDHRNGIRHDNRLSNLREATHSQNQQNSKVKRGGLKGAFFHNRKWCAQIRGNGKKTHLGYFHTEQAAHQAYVAAAKQLFGDYARAA